MGGGDLNSKKSWHPHTLKNQEQVWKAEQAKAKEEKKLNDLRREIQEEKERDELTRIGRESGVLASSKDGEKKLDWMYKNSNDLINRDEYLLGRKVDKSFEALQEEERQKEKSNLVGVKKPLNHVEHECVPFSIRAYKGVQMTEQVDLQRKFMEDPLMLIKQREMESRRKLLENPVKLKELHRMLKTDQKLQRVSKKSKKSNKEKKSKKKRKKRSRSTSGEDKSSEKQTGSDSESDLDSKLAKKLKGGIFDEKDVLRKGFNINKLLDSKFEKISQELDKAAGKKKRSKRAKSSEESLSESSDEGNQRSKRNSRTRSRERQGRESFRSYANESKSSQNYNFRDRSRSRSTSAKYQKISSKNFEKKVSSIRHRSNSPTNLKTSSLRRSRSRDKKYSQYNNSRRSRSTSNSDRYNKYHKAHQSIDSIRSRSRSTNRKRSKSPYNKQKHRDMPKTKSRTRSPSRTHKPTRNNSPKRTHQASRQSKLTDEEKQAKLQEMMLNADWREEERTQVVRKHREAYAREEQQHIEKDFDKDFLNKEVKKAMANQTSVGSRLKANLNNIQRTSAAMNSNFARK